MQVLITTLVLAAATLASLALGVVMARLLLDAILWLLSRGRSNQLWRGSATRASRGSAI